MVTELNAVNEQALLAFFTDKRGYVPYYYPTAVNTWHESLLHDTDYDGASLF